MRKHYTISLVKTSLFVAPLLVGWGCTSPQLVSVERHPPPMLPDCRDGQLIGVDSNRNMTCVNALRDGLLPPVCSLQTQALASTKDPGTGITFMYCASKGTGLNDAWTETRISNAANSISNLTVSAKALLAAKNGRAGYLGHSVMPTRGLIRSGNTIGLHAASLICSADFNIAGAHMCTPFEIYQSVANAQPGDPLDGSADVGPYWVYLEGWNDPAGAFFDPAAGLNENCGAYTYQTFDRHWMGMGFTFEAWETGGPRVPMFHSGLGGSGNTYYCSNMYPIACCL
jgi:hypothetical protein